MKVTRKYLIGLTAAALTFQLAAAIPPGPGSEHIRFSGTEIMIDASEPEFVFDDQGNFLYLSLWALYEDTWYIPSFRGSPYIVYLDSDLYIDPAPPVANTFFHAWGGCDMQMEIDGNLVTVGKAAYDAWAVFVTEDWVEATLTMSGIFWSGPLAGLVVNETLITAYPPGGSMPPVNSVVGFLMAPVNVDLNALRKAE